MFERKGNNEEPGQAKDLFLKILKDNGIDDSSLFKGNIFCLDWNMAYRDAGQSIQLEEAFRNKCIPAFKERGLSVPMQETVQGNGFDEYSGSITIDLTNISFAAPQFKR